MTFGASKNTMSRREAFSHLSMPSTFPESSQLETDEQMRRFELLRLAFFVLKLRKFEQELQEKQDTQEHSSSNLMSAEQQLRCSLLRHAIFQQVVTLTRLDAREQALQLINTCRS